MKTLSQSKVLPSWKLLFTISLFLSITGFSQSITIVDSTSGEPIEDVLVYTNSSAITAVSDKRGKVNLNSFADDEFLIFNHAAYVTVYLKKSEINTKENFLLAKADNVLPQAYIDHPLLYFLVEDDEAVFVTKSASIFRTGICQEKYDDVGKKDDHDHKTRSKYMSHMGYIERIQF